jgi:hypothetical protein
MFAEAEIYRIDPKRTIEDFKNGVFESDVVIEFSPDPDFLRIRGDEQEVFKCLTDELGYLPHEAKEVTSVVKESLLNSLVSLIIERKMREADVSDGSRVPHGSSKHIKDLEKRIKELSAWRSKKKKGSEERANYSRLVNRLKSELSSAKRQGAKKKAKSKE